MTAQLEAKVLQLEQRDVAGLKMPPVLITGMPTVWGE